MAFAYIGVGSNLGDRQAYLDSALESMASLGELIGGAPIYETAPVGPTDQGAYLNTVFAVDTSLAPGDLLAGLLSVERDNGRVRDVKWGARTLDLDLLWYDGVSVNEPDLQIPHPEIRNRRFVLAPLLELDSSLSDESGPYATSLTDVSNQPISRLTGPVAPGENRWLEGLSSAIALEALTENTWRFTSHRDWVNSGGDMFGAYLTAVSLFSVRHAAPEMAPIALTYRFLHGVRPGSSGSVVLTTNRRTSRSFDATVVISVDGRAVGHSTIGLVADLPELTNAPAVPAVRDVSSTEPIERLARSIGAEVGASARNWNPLENWSDPGLNGRDEGVLRMWSPNIAIGSADPFMTAAALLMPMDAAIWPQTMNNLNLLPDGPAISTPTIELSARFADLTDEDLHHLAEATIDHGTASSVVGTVRVWGPDGGYRGIGHSQNLIRRQRPYSSSGTKQ
ncbi:MAG: 2-amino-4-hydroxy-6-hydroxymethyldihydropteridine diphosphokinase [Acidimicrobiia bacterium]